VGQGGVIQYFSVSLTTSFEHACFTGTEMRGSRALSLKYNKARQAAITTELIEIISGAESLKG